MPELPEVETTCRGITPHIKGKKVCDVVVRQPSLRWPVPDNLPSLLARRTLLSVSRRGKYLLLGFTHGTVLCHLGMSGSLRIVSSTEAYGKHDHVDLCFSGGVVLRFNDPRRFGSLLWSEGDPNEHKLLSTLGPEPLSDEFSGEFLFQRSRKRKLALKQFLMDSHVVVGVGNIYANEALFMSGVRPTRAAGKITRAESEKLAFNIKEVLSAAIKQGGTTLKDFVGSDGKPGYFQQQLNVYGRGGEACNVCDKVLKEIRLGARTTVYCPSCQK